MNRRRTGELLTTLQRTLAPPRRANPVVAAWRWRYELTALAAAALLAVGLTRTGVVGLTVAASVVSAGLVVLARWPAGRRRLAARVRCMVTPHRVRDGCAQARVYSARGRLPAVLSCSPRPYGESVRLWLPAGVSGGDLLDARWVLATACYASDVRVVAHPRYRHIVTLEVVRAPARPTDPANPPRPAGQD